MIRFRTIDPAEQDKLAEKPVAPAPAVVKPVAPESAEDEAPTAASKGLTRKTPLRAKKPAAARPFRD
ncbi:MAG TPA: hypothetical protein VIU82_25450 [Bosea sp. (in: a-proteobacteria)]